MTQRRYLRLVDPLRPVDPSRPVTRGDCIDGPRPCPWSTCRHHLESDGDVNPLVRMLLTTETCTLDVVEANGRVGLRDVAALLGLSRERVRQIEVEACAKLEKRLPPEMRGAWAQAHSTADGVALDIGEVAS